MRISQKAKNYMVIYGGMLSIIVVIAALSAMFSPYYKQQPTTEIVKLDKAAFAQEQIGLDMIEDFEDMLEEYGDSFFINVIYYDVDTIENVKHMSNDKLTASILASGTVLEVTPDNYDEALRIMSQDIYLEKEEGKIVNIYRK